MIQSGSIVTIQKILTKLRVATQMSELEHAVRHLRSSRTQCCSTLADAVVRQIAAACQMVFYEVRGETSHCCADNSAIVWRLMLLE